MPAFKPVSIKPLSETGSKTTHTLKSANKEQMFGGKADFRPDSDFDAEQLRAGIKVEMEHTKDRDKAKEIAKDHLSESKDYYRKLKTMEDKLEDTKKSLSRANSLVKALKAEAVDEEENSLSEEEMDLKKKCGNKVKKAHDGLSPYTQREPILEEGVSTDSADSDHVFVTPKNSDPGYWAGSRTEEVDPLRPLYEVTKALKAAAILGLTRRQRMDTAYRLGLAQGVKAQKTPFATEDLSKIPIKIGISEEQTRPSYEPPVVPVRRVDNNPGYIAPKPCGDHEYKTSTTGPSEAKPIKDR